MSAPDSAPSDTDGNDVLEPDSGVPDSEQQEPECAAPKDCIVAGFDLGYCKVLVCLDGQCVA